MQTRLLCCPSLELLQSHSGASERGEQRHYEISCEASVSQSLTLFIEYPLLNQWLGDCETISAVLV